ncbi:hypothetical protein D3C80_1191020 [compost metagenome]
MAVDDCVPLFVAHFLDDAVPGVTGVIDDDVDGAVAVHRGLDESIGKVDGSHTANTGDGFTTGGTNFCNYFFRWRGIQVVDHDARSVASQFQRYATPDASTRAGDQGNFTF